MLDLANPAVISIEDCRSYATEKNLDRALTDTGLYDYRDELHFTPCRYIKVRNSAGRWTAIFLVSEYFSRNRTGGYVGFASRHGFMSV